MMNKSDEKMVLHLRCLEAFQNKKKHKTSSPRRDQTKITFTLFEKSSPLRYSKSALYMRKSTQLNQVITLQQFSS